MNRQDRAEPRDEAAEPPATELQAKLATLNELHAALSHVLEQWTAMRDVMLRLQGSAAGGERPSTLRLIQGGRACVSPIAARWR